jgi:hypothetical protein
MRQGIVNYISGNKTCDLTNTDAGIFYFYIDDDIGTISCATTSWDLNDTKVCVAIVAYNSALTPTYLLEDERHTCLIDRRDHRYNHFTRSTQLISGGALSGYTVGAKTEAGVTWAVAEALIADEDLFETLDALADGNGAGTPYGVLYRTAASAWSWKLSAVPYDYTTAGYINYDASGTQTVASATNKYINYWFAYTNITGDFRFVTIPGRAEYSSQTAAYAEDIRNYTWGGLPTAEFCIAFQVTYVTSASATNPGMCSINRVAQLNYSNVAAGVPSSDPKPVFLETALTSATWDGDSYSTAAKTLIDLSAEFGVPAGVKAVKVRLWARDSGSLANNVYFAISPNDTSGSFVEALRLWGVSDDLYREICLDCPCDANGDIYYQCAASGAGTLDVNIQIWGYYV